MPPGGLFVGLTFRSLQRRHPARLIAAGTSGDVSLSRGESTAPRCVM
jgi:hypothetical protein